MADFKNIIGTNIKISTKSSTFDGYVYTLYSGISEKDCEHIALYCPKGKGNNDFTVINLKATQIGNPLFTHKQKVGASRRKTTSNSHREYPTLT